MKKGEIDNQVIVNHAFDVIEGLLDASTYWEDPDPVYLYRTIHGVILLARQMMSPIRTYTRLDMVDYIKAHPEECVPYIKAHSEEFAEYKPLEEEEK